MLKELTTAHLLALRCAETQGSVDHTGHPAQVLVDLCEAGYLKLGTLAYVLTKKGQRKLNPAKRTYKVLSDALVQLLQDLAGADQTPDQRTVNALHASRVLFKRVQGVRTRQGRTLAWLMARGAVLQAEFGNFYRNAGTFPQTDLSHFDTYQGKVMRRGQQNALGLRYDQAAQHTPSVAQNIAFARECAASGLQMSKQLDNTFAVWMGLSMAEICAAVPAAEYTQFHGDVERAMEEPGLTEEESAALARWLVCLREVRS